MWSISAITLLWYVGWALCAPDSNLMTLRPLKKNGENWAAEIEDFEYLLMENSAVIDRSMLIKKLLETDYKVIDITYPKGWGKTANLDMIKMFLKLEAYINGTLIPRHETIGYRLFMQGQLFFDGSLDSETNKPFAISQEKEFCAKYQGNYPVIFLNLGTVFGLTLEGIYGPIKDLIGEAFGDHDYMLRALDLIIASKTANAEQKEKAEADKEMYHKYLFGSEDLNEMIESMKFLSNSLFEHFGKPSYLFIDDYDIPLWQILQMYTIKEEERDSFTEVFRKFLVTACELSPHIAKVFITGSLQLAKDYYFPPGKNVGSFHFIKNELKEFYGFREHHVKTLFAHGQAPSDLQEKALEYYNGYGPSMELSQRSFSCFSIISFLRSGFEVKQYNKFPANKPNYMQRMFEIDPFREAIGQLLAGVDTEIDKHALGNLTFSKEEYDNLKLFFLDRVPDHKLVVNAVFKIIFAYGFLSLQESPTGGPIHVVKTVKVSDANVERVMIRIPNKEVWADVDHQYYTYTTGQRLLKEMEEEEKRAEIMSHVTPYA